ncbi:MAG: hypothetical protein V4537_14265 [Pseudomonadota bacterium]
MRRHLPPAAFFLMMVFGSAMIAAAPSGGCAHVSPADFVTCMQDEGRTAAFINAVEDILDGDNRVHALEQLAIAVGPSALKCALEQIASKKGAGPAVDLRAKRAREYLDSHGG